MTAKRFTYEIDEENGHLVDVWYDDGKPIYSANKVCELLNHLHEENKELKKENAQFDILIKNNQLAYIDLEKENEQLRKENQTLIQGIQDTAKQGAETITKVWESKNQPNIIKRGYYD